MTSEHELWAVALWIEKHHGDAGPVHIAEEITRLAQEGDWESVSRWRKIADRYDLLKETSEPS